MRIAQFKKAGGPIELTERTAQSPRPGSVRIKVEACGVCHSDVLTQGGAWPGIELPRAPGHEVVGRIDSLGPGVEGWSVGQRVGLGWHGGHDGTCDRCRRGDFITCRKLQIPGLSYDGGYADYVTAPAVALAHIPDQIASVDAAPLMCAGVTTFNALRHSGARPGDTVAVLGLGGLGHLAVQFAAKMGFRTVAIARGPEKAELAAQLGAFKYIDSKAEQVGPALLELGGAAVVLATVTNADAMASTIGGLDIDGKLLVLGAPQEPLSSSVFPLIMGRRAIAGWPSGTMVDSEDTLRFSVLTGVRPMTEVFPLSHASEAYDRMLSGKARFRVVLTP
ncbi:MAG: alcohol dehydrogenase catalytic domain-containing protein [Polyangiaceae bacterium]|nr:alcohol dehydrogenase catalytic domain-containing protein [Polyangiaceae bacterium]